MWVLLFDLCSVSLINNKQSFFAGKFVFEGGVLFAGSEEVPFFIEDFFSFAFAYLFCCGVGLFFEFLLL